MNIKITQQGKPVVRPEAVFVLKQTEELAIFCIDMRSKWCEIMSTCSGSDGELGFSLTATEYSTHLNETTDFDWTDVVLADFDSREWEIFTVQCCRYTISVVLIKRALYGRT